MFGYSFVLNSELERQLYNSILNGINLHKPAISIGYVNPDIVNKVIKTVLNDNPEIFWFEGKWKLKNGCGGCLIVPYYIIDDAQILPIKNKIKKCVDSFSCLKNKRTYEKVEYLYDWFLDNVEYSNEESDGQNIMDALVSKKAVCKGIAKGYQYLLNKQGVFSTLVEGTLDGITKHIWNVVEIDNCFYNVDVCMGYEGFSCLFSEEYKVDKYRCLLVSDARISNTHRFNETNKHILTCDKDY